MTDYYFYEHPLNEKMRLFLRFEFLWDQAQYHLNNDHEYSYRATISFLIEILELTERGDIKSEVYKELDQKLVMLNHVLKYPDANKEDALQIINKIEDMKDAINHIDNNFIAVLKNSQLLNTIRHRSSAPGGLLAFDLPELQHWLRCPIEKKERRLQRWLSNFEVIASAIYFILWLNREWIDLKPAISVDGTYSYQMDHQASCNLIRFGLNHDLHYFPEISAGRHRFIIRFCKTDNEDKPSQAEEEVNFLIGMI